MSRTPRYRRTAAAEATRRWRRRQATGIRLVTVEVSEVRLARLVRIDWCWRRAIEDFARLSAVITGP
jgi:hypothetical protein